MSDVAGVVPWLCVAVYTLAPGTTSAAEPPAFVYGIIFSLFAFFCLCMAALSLAGALVFQLVSLFLLGVGAILLGVLVLALGLLAVLLKQIMDSDRVRREPPEIAER